MKITDRLVYIIIMLLKLISDKLTIQKRTQFGRFIGNVLRLLSKKRESITLTNIRLAFPTKTDTEIKSICKLSYQNLGITFIELLHLDKLTRGEAETYCKFNNVNIINEYQKKGRGLILLSAHFGNWEYTAYTGGLFSEIPLNLVVKPQKNVIIDKVLNQYRTKSNNKVINMYEAARDIYTTLLQGNVLALMVDQSATKDKDVFIEFFGRPASVYLAPAKLALRNKTPLLIGLSKRNIDGTYSINIEEIYSDDLENNEDGIIELTLRHVKYLENKIKENPELWAWQHNRWKHKPNGKIYK
ncbi:lysophospholipid acyltransferase family protein [Candidatus Kapabacteria bacterium]|nr:lysophospholipid acyltransferase family protein [Candidatus Kapabacteria bacterium]